MWVFPTRNRPKLAQRLVDACVATHMTSPGVIIVDGHEVYPNIKLPPNINIMSTGDWIEFAAVMNLALRMYPDERYYGFICDDCVPRTDYWDKRLEEAAGDWFVSCSNGLLKTD